MDKTQTVKQLREDAQAIQGPLFIRQADQIANRLRALANYFETPSLLVGPALTKEDVAALADHFNCDVVVRPCEKTKARIAPELPARATPRLLSPRLLSPRLLSPVVKPAPGTVGALKALIAPWPDSFLVSMCTEEMDADDVLIDGCIVEGATSDGPGHVELNVREAKRTHTIGDDLRVYGQAFEIDGERIDPQRVVMHKRGGV